jgi:plastocyanin
MKSSRSTVCASLAFALGAFASSSAVAHDDDAGSGKIVTVAFGAGLNTAQPGNPENHHLVPDVIKVRVGDVVNFAVAGLHIIRVYERGVKLRDVKDLIPAGCEVNPDPPTGPWPPQCFPGGPVPVIPPLGLGVYYEGLNPLATPSTNPPPAFTLRSTAQNRVETVLFSKPGRFLVICAVLPHFNDKMYAWVEVSRDGR